MQGGLAHGLLASGAGGGSMKFLAGVLASLVIFGCGVLSMVFGMPQPYITRAVDKSELSGIWTLPADTEASMDAFVRRSPHWPAVAPWRSMTLSADNSCRVELALEWLSRMGYAGVSPQVAPPGVISSCAWHLGEFASVDGKPVPAVSIAVKSGEYNGGGYLYINEENGGLTLWTFIGDPDDFRTLDFRKSGP